MLCFDPIGRSRVPHTRALVDRNPSAEPRLRSPVRPERGSSLLRPWRIWIWKEPPGALARTKRRASGGARPCAVLLGTALANLGLDLTAASTGRAPIAERCGRAGKGDAATLGHASARAAIVGVAACPRTKIELHLRSPVSPD